MIGKIAKLIERLGVPGFASGIKWKKQFGYRRENARVDVRWARLPTHGIISAPMSALRAPIHVPGGKILATVENTPHFAWISALVAGSDDAEESAAYRAYLCKYYPQEDPEDGLRQVRNLVEVFRNSTERLDDIAIVCNEPITTNDGLVILIFDGVHRTAIAQALGRRSIRCRLVTGKVDRSHFVLDQRSNR